MVANFENTIRNGQEPQTIFTTTRRYSNAVFRTERFDTSDRISPCHSSSGGLIGVLKERTLLLLYPRLEPLCLGQSQRVVCRI